MDLNKLKEKFMLIPSDDRIILEKIEQENQTRLPSGIILSSSMPKQECYKVISSGKLCNCEGYSKVYVDKFKGQAISKDGYTYLIVKQEDILAYEVE